MLLNTWTVPQNFTFQTESAVLIIWKTLVPFCCCPPVGYFLRTNTPPAQRSFQGCMQLIHVDDQLADLVAVEQGNMGTFENVSLDMCAIIDR